jgi:hypothetical protein
VDGLRRLRDTVGVHRHLFGTNLPFVVAESPVTELAGSRLPAAEGAAVRSGYAGAMPGITSRRITSRRQGTTLPLTASGDGADGSRGLGQ